LKNKIGCSEDAVQEINKTDLKLCDGRLQDFFQGWALSGSEGQKYPSMVQGHNSGGGLWIGL